MYDYETGAYFYTAELFPHESEYRFDNTYYIKYSSKKALFALEKLKKLNENFNDGIFLSHVYMDLLFEAVGQVINRFIDKNPNGYSDSDNRSKQIRMNIKEYGFNVNRYPLLNDSRFRNHLEHIDEKDQVLIEKRQYHGTFNVIYSGIKSELKDELMSHENSQNNLLNLEDMSYTILNSDRKSSIATTTIIKRSIDLNSLEKEVKEIYRISCAIWNYMQDDMFK